MLALPGLEFRRDEVMALIADAPVRWVGGRAPSTQWERLSRRAGVVRGDDWTNRLSAYAESRRAEAAEAREAPDATPDAGDRYERAAGDADALKAFVEDLRGRLDALAAAESWASAGDGPGQSLERSPGR